MSGRGDWNSVTHSGFRRGRVHGAAQPGGLLERAGAPATSSASWRKSAAGSAASPSREEGREQGCPRLPRELASQARSSGSSSPGLCLPGPGALQSQVRAPLGSRQPDADEESGERAGAAQALGSWGPRRPWIILHSGCLSLAASPSLQGCGEGNETWLKSPCSHLRQGAPQPTLPPVFHDAEGRYLEIFWMQREVLTQPCKAPGCCNLFMPTAEEVAATGEENASSEMQRPNRDEMENATRPPWHSGDTEGVWVLHLCQIRPILCREQSVPRSDPKGAVSLEKGEGGRNTFHMITAAVSVIPHLCFAIPSADHKGANFRETLHQQQPAFWILSLGIRLQHRQDAGSSTSTEERECDPARQQKSKHPRLFPQEDFG